MKKITSVLCLILFVAVAANAQEFKKFRVGVGAGYAGASGEGASGGVLIYLEPGYRITDKILVGARFEGAVIVRGYSASVNTGSASGSLSGTNGLFGQYFLTNNNFRPFVGLGLGVFNVSTAAATSTTGQTTVTYAAIDESKIGFFPRIGFDLNHFTVSFDYNIVGASELTGSDGSKLDSKNNYFGIRVGGFFGGGRK